MCFLVELIIYSNPRLLQKNLSNNKYRIFVVKTLGSTYTKYYKNKNSTILHFAKIYFFVFNYF
jgi:hypothetical protein